MKPIPILTAKHLNRFDSFYIRGSIGECWKWRGKPVGPRRQQYGRFSVGREIVRAHRLAFFLFHGFISNSLFVLHRCDHPLCVNPNHLFLGTHADNIKDEVSKGRARKRPLVNGVSGLVYKTGRGKHSGMRKLSEDDVLRIRQLLYQRESDTDIARKFGVAISTVSRIAHGDTWKHVVLAPREKVEQVSISNPASS